MPIHCLVEHITSPGKESTIAQDTYAILPGTTLFCDTVRSALTKLGYSAADTLGARGWLNRAKYPVF